MSKYPMKLALLFIFPRQHTNSLKAKKKKKKLECVKNVEIAMSKSL